MEGDNVEVALKEAEAGDVAALEKAAEEGGSPEAQRRLGRLYDEGVVVRKDDAKARSWYERSANAGDADAQYHLGIMLREGRGVGKHDDDDDDDDMKSTTKREKRVLKLLRQARRRRVPPLHSPPHHTVYTSSRHGCKPLVTDNV